MAQLAVIIIAGNFTVVKELTGLDKLVSILHPPMPPWNVLWGRTDPTANVDHI